MVGEAEAGDNERKSMAGGLLLFILWSENELFQCAQAGGGNLRRGTGGIVLLDLLIKPLGLVRLLRAIRFRQPQLRLRLADRGSGVGNQLLVQLDGLGIAAGVSILVGQRKLSQRSQIGIMSLGDILELFSVAAELPRSRYVRATK